MKDLFHIVCTSKCFKTIHCSSPQIYSYFIMFKLKKCHILWFTYEKCSFCIVLLISETRCLIYLQTKCKQSKSHQPRVNEQHMPQIEFRTKDKAVRMRQ